MSAGGWTAQGRRHGTRSGYQGGCRCEACRAANRAYVTAWRHATGRTDPALRDLPGHGRSGYRRGCRCEVCRAANAAAARRGRARRRAEG